MVSFITKVVAGLIILMVLGGVLTLLQPRAPTRIIVDKSRPTIVVESSGNSLFPQEEPTAQPTPTPVPRKVPDQAKLGEKLFEVRGMGTYTTTVQLDKESVNAWLVNIPVASKQISYRATGVIFAGWATKDIIYNKESETSIHVYVTQSPQILAIDTKPPEEGDFYIESTGLAGITGDWFGQFRSDRQLQIAVQTKARAQLLDKACNLADSETDRMLSEITITSLKAQITEMLALSDFGGWEPKEITFHMPDGSMLCTDPQPGWLPAEQP